MRKLIGEGPTLHLQKWIESFPWESETQKKGFLSYLQWFKKLPVFTTCVDGVDSRLFCMFAYFAQKDHEAEDWRTKLYGDQITRLENEIMALKLELAGKK